MRPLSALFIDCDSYFASVEQHLDPALRGKAVGVAPVMAETSCCIAASYEAKRFGVKTGTRISDARILCPGIAIVEAKPPEYVRYHNRIVEAVEDCIHVEEVLSIDEMWAWLPLNLREPATIRRIAERIKAKVSESVSPAITVSIGVAPNRYLAKIASKMRKPDGLFLIEESELPEALYPLELRDLTGIARSMESRLHAAGIHSVAALCRVEKAVLRGVWGGVLGERLWHLLRGDVIPDLVSSRKSIGHSHVLPPDSRAPGLAWPVLCKLLHKACERLRAHGMLAASLTVKIAFFRGVSWSPKIRFQETDSTRVLMKLLDQLWRDRPDPKAPILQVGVVLARLVESGNFTPDLFANHVADLMSLQDDKQKRLDAALDRLRVRYGRDVVYYGSVQDSRDKAPMRISFTHIPDLGIESDRRS
ncbi:DNA polymerase Y family protein [Haloferula sargassicola]|uniref:DNA polymerase Y family protein n=1 Tax=Haloferula sargassicola TaxID=490096 RepID=UPI003365A014